MKNSLKHFCLDAQPQAESSALVISGGARFTVLSERLIRCEFEADGRFEDRPSQTFWYRRQPVPRFRVTREHGVLILTTRQLELRWREDSTAFAPDSLSIALRATGTVWKFGDCDPENLRGTARTLDECDGGWHTGNNAPLPVSEGLLSPSGWAVIDDAKSLVFDEDGFLNPRERTADDFYFFGHGMDAAAALKDYYAVTGHPPLLPKFSLGLWWSRWAKYRQSDLENIVAEFKTNGVPLSVCVVDMDWHLPGWTGYTWNPEFFPDPRGFLRRLHAQGVRACLNLHPASGVGPHEAAYPAMARLMGMDAAKKQSVPFDLTDRTYLDGYFRLLHHPLEKDGVDFWWMDWQQGTKTKWDGLDPLWYLNHLHAVDLGRDGRKRPFVFSRWGDCGAHRYPVGFSGDTCRTWNTLRYQVWFTATAANIGYGWWSHDLGGFARGLDDDELYVRWLQFGCFSPVFRLHNCGDQTLDYRPWNKQPAVRDAALAAMRLRRSLLPYLYTAARRNSLGGLPMITPMYHRHAEEEARCCPQQYYFGDDLVAAPFAEPADHDTRLSRQVVWLPAPGSWFGFQDGRPYAGGRWHAVRGGLNDIPVFARAGAIIPLTGGEGNDWELLCFPGDGQAEIYDDDGETRDHEKDVFQQVRCEQIWQGGRMRFTAAQQEGALRMARKFTLRLRGLRKTGVRTLTAGGKKVRPEWDGDDLVVKNLRLPMSGKLTVNLSLDRVETRPGFTVQDIERLLYTFQINCHSARRILDRLPGFFDALRNDPSALGPYLAELAPAHIRCLIEAVCDMGAHHLRLPDGRDVICHWNPRSLSRLAVRIGGRANCDDWEYRVDTRGGFFAFARHPDAPGIRRRVSGKGGMQILPKSDGWSCWRGSIHYADLMTVPLDGTVPPRRICSL